MAITDNLRSIRKERGLSQMVLADLLQTTQQQYSKYENGIQEIPIRHVVTICQFYGVSSDWLLGLQDTKKSDK